MSVPELIVIVRHGESDENRILTEQIARYGSEVGVVRAGILIAQHAYDGDPPITRNGRSQAETAGAWLRRHYGVFDVHFVSEMQRTHQTMNALAPHAAHVTSMLLDEFTLHGCNGDCGTEREVLPRNEWEADLSRVNQFFDELCSGSYAGGKILVAGHGNWIAAARRHPHPAIIMPHGEEQEPVENASVSTFRKIVNTNVIENLGRIRGSQLLLDRAMVVPWKSPEA